MYFTMKDDSSYFWVQALPSRKIYPPSFSSDTNLASTRSYWGGCSINAHDDDRVVFPIRLVGQQVGVDKLPIIPELFRTTIKIVD
jgi:hypothetical protein